MPDAGIQGMAGAALAAHARKTGRGMTIGEIQGVLFLARGRMRGDDPLYRRLAYYWMADGPVSNVVRRAVAEMADSGAAGCAGGAYVPGGAGWEPDGAGARAAAEIAVLEAGQIEEEVWSQAPIPGFATNYRKFTGAFKAYAGSVIDHKDGKPDLQFVMDLFNEAVFLLQEGTRTDDMPMGREFFEFRLQCNLYSQSLDILVRNDPGRDELMPGRYEQALRGSAAIWDAFVAISRLCDPDPQYDGRVAEWKKEHEASMGSLRRIVKGFADSVEDLPIPKEEGDDEILAVMNEIDNDKDKFSRGCTIEEELEFIRKLGMENPTSLDEKTTMEMINGADDGGDGDTRASGGGREPDREACQGWKIDATRIKDKMEADPEVAKGVSGFANDLRRLGGRDPALLATKRYPPGFI